MAKTAIDTIIEYMKSNQYFIGNDLVEVFITAKELEKQQIIEAAKWMPNPYDKIEFIPELAEQYYNQQFKQD